MRELERQVLLSVLDRKWREHLYEMDYLREGIGLRAYSQRDPLVEYQREGFDMFNAMKEGIREETVGFLFNLEVQVEEEEDELVELDARPAGRRRHQRRLRPPDEPRCTTTPATATSTTRRTSSPRACRPPSAPQNLTYSAPSEDGEAEVKGTTVEQRRRPLRRAPAATTLCPCGSGKKYKKCHGAPGRSDRPDRAPGAADAQPNCRAVQHHRPSTQLDAGGDGAGALAVADVHADLRGLGRGAEQVHAAHLAAQPADPAIAGRGAGQQGGAALQLGVDLLARPAQQLAGAAVATDDLDDGRAKRWAKASSSARPPAHQA